MVKNGSFDIVELNDTTGYIDFECTLEVPEAEGGGMVHFAGRINATRLPPEKVA